LLFRGALQNYCVEILNAAREFGLPAQDFIELFPLFVQSGGAFEIELLAGFLALFLDRGAEEPPLVSRKCTSAALRRRIPLSCSQQSRREHIFISE